MTGYFWSWAGTAAVRKARSMNPTNSFDLLCEFQRIRRAHPSEAPAMNFLIDLLELGDVGYAIDCALAAGSRRAKTPQAVECEASQSGAESATPTPFSPPSPSIGSIDMTQDLGGNSGSREPDPQAVPALSGFDPGRDLDPRTGRPFGDHGTAEQAVEYALDHAENYFNGCVNFLSAWREGALDEWPEFYEWLAAQSTGEAA